LTPRYCALYGLPKGFGPLERRAGDPPLVRVERGAPPAWAPGLRARGYRVIESPPGDQTFGHAQAIRVPPDGLLAGAADPRSGDGATVGR
jgi:gamma-glutamyltranspeptidase/glutathione hydrolase